MRTFYHVTAVDNFIRIQNEDLILNNGQIFLFDKKEYAPTIAINQCFLMDFALFSVKNIDEQRLQADNVAEFTAHAQWIYDKPIPSTSLKFVNCYKVISQFNGVLCPKINAINE